MLCWTRDPSRLRALAGRKAALTAPMVAHPRCAPPGVLPFLRRLRSHGTPCALACAEPAAAVTGALKEAGLDGFFSEVVTAEDVQRGIPDPEAALLAASRLARPPARCLLVGCSNAGVEAGRDAGLRVIAVTGAAGRPAFELAAADAVVRRLDELTVQSLQQMFAQDEERPKAAVDDGWLDDGGAEEEEEDDEFADRFGSSLF